MSDWFTVEQLDAGTFAVSEYRHWEETHCYLLLGQEKALLIDTGLGAADIRAVVERLTDLPVQVATTHVHWDHIGGHSRFDEIAVYEAEKDWLSGSFPIPLSAVKKNLLKEPCTFPAGFDAEQYQLYQGGADIILHDGDILELGDRRVEAVHTPGHSPGHICLYERERRYLFAGDLIYAGCLDAFYPTTDPERFAESVDRVRALPVERVFPGHHRLEIPVSMIAQISGAFSQLKAAGKLKQGSGIFAFGDFQIHL